MDTSSSEDEVSRDILKEAVDQQFLNDNLYHRGKLQLTSQSSKFTLHTIYFAYYCILCVLFFKFTQL